MSRSFLTSHVPGSSSPFCIELGVPWQTAVFPHSNCWHLRSMYSLHGHQWVTCQSVLNIYVLSDAVLGSRNVVVNKTQSLTWKVYTGCRGKKKTKNKKTSTYNTEVPALMRPGLGAWPWGRGEHWPGFGDVDWGWRGCSREVSIRKLFQASIWKSY